VTRPILPLCTLALLALGVAACPGSLTDPDLILAVRAASVCDAPSQVFAARCAGCHSPGPAEYVNLDLTSPGVAKRVTGTRSTCQGEVLVVAGKPDASYLYTKLTEPNPTCGSQMPLNGSLGADDLACVESWIVGLAGSTPPPDTSCGDNLDPAHATPIPGATGGCIATNGIETHFFSLSAPSDAGGTFVVSIDEVGAGTLEGQVLFPGDGGGAEIVHVSAYQPGGSLGLFFAAAAGQTYWVAVFQVVTTSARFKYVIQESFTPTGDPSAGHATPASALPIAVGTPANGAFFAGYTSASPPAPADLGTWFQVELQARPVVIALQHCPSDIRAQVDLTDATGATILATAVAAGDGLDVTLDAGAPTAGTYLVHAYPYEAPLDSPSGGGTNPPPYFGQTYTLDLTQY